MPTRKPLKGRCEGCGYVKCQCKPGDAGGLSETPADNADKGVVVDREKDDVVCHAGTGCPICVAGEHLGTFYVADSGMLPEIKRNTGSEFRDGENNIGALADVFWASGFCGNLTPAQIAVHIIAGRSLGLDDAQSVFDLEIGPGPTVRYRPGQPYQAAADDVDAAKAKLKPGDDRPTPEPASPPADPAFTDMAEIGADAIKKNESNVSKFPVSEKTGKPLYTRSDVEKDTAATNVQEIGANLPAGSIVDQKSTPAAEKDQKIEHLANKGPLLDPPAQDDERGDGTPTEQSAAASDASAAASDASAAAISENQADDMRPINPGPGPILESGSVTPDPASTAAAHEAIGEVGPETVAAWRQALIDMCLELGIPSAEKVATFDTKTIVDKRKMFEDAQKYYAGKLDAVRYEVLELLKADGKADLDAMKGFFIFAEVNTAPIEWTYTEAKKAEKALGDFTSSKPAA